MSDFHIKAMLQCGAVVEIRQPGESQMLELTFYPKEGTKIEDTAYIRDGNLRINASIPALLGFRELIGMIFRMKPVRKKFLGLF